MTDFEITYRGARLDQAHFEKYTPGERIAWKAGVDAAILEAFSGYEQAPPEDHTALVNGFGETIREDVIHEDSNPKPKLRTWIVGPRRDRESFVYSHLIEFSPGRGYWADTHTRAAGGLHGMLALDTDNLWREGLSEAAGNGKIWDLREITPGVPFTTEPGFHEPAASQLVDVSDGMHLIRVAEGQWAWDDGTNPPDVGRSMPWGYYASAGYTFRVLEER